jgi:hypothetical protein
MCRACLNIFMTVRGEANDEHRPPIIAEDLWAGVMVGIPSSVSFRLSCDVDLPSKLPSKSFRTRR